MPIMLIVLLQQKQLRQSIAQAQLGQAAAAATAGVSSQSDPAGQLQGTNRPSPIPPDHDAQQQQQARAVTASQMSSALLHRFQQGQQQQNLQLQHNLQLVAANPLQAPRARMTVPMTSRQTPDSAMAGAVGANPASMPFTVSRLPQMIIAQNPTDSMHQQQLLNQPSIGDVKPPHPIAVASSQVRMLNLAPSRQSAPPRLTLTLPPPRPMHSSSVVVNHALPASGFRSDHHHQAQLNDQQTMLSQQPPYAMTLDLPGLGHSMTDGDITPLTPQDQLSRYVEQL